MTNVPDGLAESVGATETGLADLYRLLAIAKYDERYVIPPAHAEDAGRLMAQHEQLFCAQPGGPDSFHPRPPRSPATTKADCTSTFLPGASRDHQPVQAGLSAAAWPCSPSRPPTGPPASSRPAMNCRTTCRWCWTSRRCTRAARSWLIWAVWPFSRLVHAWSVPLWYLWRPYIVYRSRVAARPAEPGTSGRGWRKISVPY